MRQLLGTFLLRVRLALFSLGLTDSRANLPCLSTADDYSAFSRAWTEPEGGLQGYLIRFLESRDTTFQHIAIWTLVQLLESGGEFFLCEITAFEVKRADEACYADPTLENQIRSSTHLMSLANQLSSLTSSQTDGEGNATGTTTSASGSSVRSGSDDGEEDGGEGEIRVLAKRVLDLLEGTAEDI